MNWLYTTTTGWALLQCGVALVLLPVLPWWSHGGHTTSGLEFLTEAAPKSWILALLPVLTGCFLFATQPVARVPLWRTAGLVAAALAMMATTIRSVLDLQALWGGSPHVGPYCVL